MAPTQAMASSLTISPHSESYADLDILKPANYTVALRVGTGGNHTVSCPATYVQCYGVAKNEDINTDDSSDQLNDKSFISLSFIKKEEGIENRFDKNVNDSNEIYLGDVAKKNVSDGT